MFPGVPLVPLMAAGGTDAAFLTPAGIPTYGLSGLFADREGSHAHGLDERIRVKSLIDAASSSTGWSRPIRTEPSFPRSRVERRSEPGGRLDSAFAGMTNRPGTARRCPATPRPASCDGTSPKRREIHCATDMKQKAPSLARAAALLLAAAALPLNRPDRSGNPAPAPTRRRS